MRDFQLREAARLLRTTAMTIIEIAERTGFGRVESTFYRAFRDAFDMTPTEFRRTKK
jgi:AraC-like DNA-binding protein